MYRLLDEKFGQPEEQQTPGKSNRLLERPSKGKTGREV
jgi:hypothetical protein